MDFGEKLKALRKERGLSQAQLADKAGLSNGAIGNYESGKRTKISVEALCRLADALSVDPEELGLQRRYDLEKRVQESMQRHLMDKMKKDDDKNLEAAIRVFLSLNAKGQAVALERLRELAELNRYKG